jgi:hypothetical protein
MPAETEPLTSRQKRRKVAGLIVLLVFGIPVVYSVIMGIVTIVRYILADAG